MSLAAASMNTFGMSRCTSHLPSSVMSKSKKVVLLVSTLMGGPNLPLHCSAASMFGRENDKNSPLSFAPWLCFRPMADGCAIVVPSKVHFSKLNTLAHVHLPVEGELYVTNVTNGVPGTTKAWESITPIHGPRQSVGLRHPNLRGLAKAWECIIPK